MCLRLQIAPQQSSEVRRDDASTFYPPSEPSGIGNMVPGSWVDGVTGCPITCCVGLKSAGARGASIPGGGLRVIGALLRAIGCGSGAVKTGVAEAAGGIKVGADGVVAERVGAVKGARAGAGAMTTGGR